MGVDSRDASCWTCNSTFFVNELLKVDRSGFVVLRVPGLSTNVLAVDSSNGDVWLAIGPQIIKLDSNGTELSRFSVAARSTTASSCARGPGLVRRGVLPRRGDPWLPA